MKINFFLFNFKNRKMLCFVCKEYSYGTYLIETIIQFIDQNKELKKNALDLLSIFIRIWPNPFKLNDQIIKNKPIMGSLVAVVKEFILNEFSMKHLGKYTESVYYHVILVSKLNNYLNFVFLLLITFKVLKILCNWQFQNFNDHLKLVEFIFLNISENYESFSKEVFVLNGRKIQIGF